MIPYVEPDADQPDAEEPAETKGLSKSAMYRTLSETFFLPPKDAKGVNRKYVVGVWHARFLRIATHDIKQFEVNVNSKLSKKSPYLNLTSLLARLERYLEERALMPTGFKVVPTEDYFLRLVRYVDQQNLLGAFLHPMPNAPTFDTMSHRLYNMKLEIRDFLLGGDEFKNNLKVANLLTEIYNHKKRIDNCEDELEKLGDIRIMLNRKISTETANLQSSIHKAASTILSIGRGIDDIDVIFQEGAGLDLRVQLAEIVKLLKFIYTVDVVQDRDEWILQVAQEQEGRLLAERNRDNQTLPRNP